MCLAFPDACVGRRDSLSPLASSKVLSPGLLVGRGWKRLGERMIHSQRDLDPMHGVARSTENPALTV